MRAVLSVKRADRAWNRAPVLFCCVFALGIIAGPRAQVPRYITPKVVYADTNQIPLTNVSSEFEKDVMELMARLEGWHDITVAQFEDKLTRQWLEHMLSFLPPLPKEEVDSIAEEFKPKYVEGIRARTVMVIGQHFTHEDVRQLIAFYKTPLGRKYAAAYPEICAKMAEGDMRRDRLRDELVDRLRTRFPDAF